MPGPRSGTPALTPGKPRSGAHPARRPQRGWGFRAYI